MFIKPGFSERVNDPNDPLFPASGGSTKKKNIAGGNLMQILYE
jgi:hypothetical protein